LIKKVRELLLAGTVTAPSAEALLAVPRQSAERLVSETDNEKITLLQWEQLDALSLAYVTVPGQGEHALAIARKMRELAQQLFDRRKTDPAYGANLAMSNERVADALEARGMLAAAFTFNDEARRVVDGLLAHNPSDPRLTMRKGLIHQRLGDIHRAKGNVDD